MAPATQNIFFHFLSPAHSLGRRTDIRAALWSLFKRERIKVEAINYIFCSDTYLLKVNQQYLNHNTLTDIITFQLNEPAQPILSDIYISIDRVKENAQLLGVTQKVELMRVIFHGALHLCGYNDKTKSDKLMMRDREDFYLKAYFGFT